MKDQTGDSGGDETKRARVVGLKDPARRDRNTPPEGAGGASDGGQLPAYFSSGSPSGFASSSDLARPMSFLDRASAALAARLA